MLNNVMEAAKNVISRIYKTSTRAACQIGYTCTRLVKNTDIENQLRREYTLSEVSRYSLTDFSVRSVDSFEVVSWIGPKGSSNPSKQRLDFNKSIPGLERAIKQFDIQAKKLKRSIDEKIKHLETQELLDNLESQRAKVKLLGHWREEIQARTKARRLARRAANKV